jgi:hypothetical protein
MHQLTDPIPRKPTIAEVLALVCDEASPLLGDVTDEQIDKAIQQDINRPAATLHLLAGSALATVEFDVLVDKLRVAVADGSVLDYESAADQEMRAFRRASPPPPSELPALAYAQKVAGGQFFLGRRHFHPCHRHRHRGRRRHQCC